ncbi:MAG: hypothetical protein ACK5GN_00330 [Pseudomonadota bacterium]
MGETKGQRIAAVPAGAGEGGWYLLECAAVLLGVAVFIVGFSDVSRIFHARGAVRAGVTEGLRCLYPTNAGCSEQELSAGWPTSERFNARITGDQTNKYELPRISYSLSSSWFNEPMLEASYATRRLTAVRLTQPQDAYRQYQVLFPGTAHAVYLLKTQDLPQVDVGTQISDSEAVLNPRFFDPDTGSPRSANKQIRVASMALNTSQHAAEVPVDTAVTAFTIEARDILQNASSWSNLKALETAHRFTAACYQGARTTLPDGSQGIAWPSSGKPQSCNYRADPTALYNGTIMRVPVMIHVEGNGYITPHGPWPDWRGVSGQVTLKLYQGGREIADLGGREFSRASSSRSPRFDRQLGNFVVRGAGYTADQNFDVSSAYRRKCESAGYSECRSYITMPLITVGQPVELRLGLEWRSRRGLRKRPNVTIRWEGGNVRVFFPSFSVSREQRGCGVSSTPNTCSDSVAPMQTSYTITNLEQPLRHQERDETQCARVAPSGYLPSVEEALESFRAELKSGTRPLEAISFWSAGAATDRCDPKVALVSCDETPREYMKGCEPQYSFPADAASYCSLSDYQADRDVVDEPQYADGESSKTTSRGACSGEEFPECARPHLINSGTTLLGVVGNGCSKALPVNAPVQEIGPLYADTCGSALPDLIKRYRKRYAVPDAVPVNSYQRPEIPVITDEIPRDPCRAYTQIETGSGRSWICAERAPYAVANTCCKRYGASNCSLESVTVGEGGGSSGGYDQLIEAARQRAFMTTQAAYPPARMDLSCGQDAAGEPSDDDCIAIRVAPAENNTSAQMRASIRVPLALFDWFGLGNHTVVQYEETRKLESALVGEAS